MAWELLSIGESYCVRWASELEQRSHISRLFFFCRQISATLSDHKRRQKRIRGEIAVGRGNATDVSREKYCIIDGTYRGLPVTVPFRSSAHRHPGTFKVIGWRWIYDRDGYAVNPGTWEAELHINPVIHSDRDCYDKNGVEFKDNPKSTIIKSIDNYSDTWPWWSCPLAGRFPTRRGPSWLSFLNNDHLVHDSWSRGQTNRGHSFDSPCGGRSSL